MTIFIEEFVDENGPPYSVIIGEEPLPEIDAETEAEIDAEIGAIIARIKARREG